MNFLRRILILIGCSFLFVTLSYNSITDIIFEPFSQPISILKFSEYKDDFCVLYDFWTPDDYFLDTVTFVVHANYDYIDYIEKQTQSWTGAISLAIQIFSVNETAITISNLKAILSKLDRLKSVQSSQSVGVHLFYRKFSEKCNQFIINNEEINNNNYNITNDNVIYPINVARNIARIGAKTKLFLSGDIENFFLEGYEKRIRSLAKKELIEKDQNLVLVHRRFEVDENTLLPKNKSELFNLFKNRLAVSFHHHFYGIGHRIPDLAKWFSEPENLNETTIQMIVPYLNAQWEPQFVGNVERVPFHDESFPFRMRSNTHLGSEMCRRGFKFGIVNDLFTVHKGIKKKESLIERAAKIDAWKNGYKQLVQNFIDRLDSQYPNTTELCPKFKP